MLERLLNLHTFDRRNCDFIQQYRNNFEWKPSRVAAILHLSLFTTIPQRTTCRRRLMRRLSIADQLIWPSIWSSQIFKWKPWFVDLHSGAIQITNSASILPRFNIPSISSSFCCPLKDQNESKTVGIWDSLMPANGNMETLRNRNLFPEQWTSRKK